MKNIEYDHILDWSKDNKGYVINVKPQSKGEYELYMRRERNDIEQSTKCRVEDLSNRYLMFTLLDALKERIKVAGGSH